MGRLFESSPWPWVGGGNMGGCGQVHDDESQTHAIMLRCRPFLVGKHRDGRGSIALTGGWGAYSRAVQGPLGGGGSIWKGVGKCMMMSAELMQ